MEYFWLCLEKVFHAQKSNVTDLHECIENVYIECPYHLLSMIYAYFVYGSEADFLNELMNNE